MPCWGCRPPTLLPRPEAGPEETELGWELPPGLLLPWWGWQQGHFSHFSPLRAGLHLTAPMQSPYGARLLPTLVFLTPLPPGFRSLRSHRGSWHLNPRQGPFARVIPPAVPRRPANPLRNARRAGNRRPFEAPTEQPCPWRGDVLGDVGAKGVPFSHSHPHTGSS